MWPHKTAGTYMVIFENQKLYKVKVVKQIVNQSITVVHINLKIAFDTSLQFEMQNYKGMNIYG